MTTHAPDTTRSFRALIIRSAADGLAAAEIIPATDLPAGDVLVAVEYSGVNYKDALAIREPAKVIRQYPMVPGIDLAGVVVESCDERFRPGDRVLSAGFGNGEIRWGGYAERARLPAAAVARIPDGLSTRQAMILGTAGFTAALCVDALERHGLRDRTQPTLVTGAAGGVGTVSIALLSALGYRAVAVTGRPEHAGFLRELGATDVITRDELARAATRPLSRQLWGGCIDSVGGDQLGAVVSTMAEGGSVALTGMAGGTTFHASVLPFILRSVNLLGVNSVYPSDATRAAAWQRLAAHVPMRALEAISTAITLDDVVEASADVLAGRVRGRLVVNVAGR